MAIRTHLVYFFGLWIPATVQMINIFNRIFEGCIAIPAVEYLFIELGFPIKSQFFSKALVFSAEDSVSFLFSDNGTGIARKSNGLAYSHRRSLVLPNQIWAPPSTIYWSAWYLEAMNDASVSLPSFLPSFVQISNANSEEANHSRSHT